MPFAYFIYHEIYQSGGQSLRRMEERMIIHDLPPKDFNLSYRTLNREIIDLGGWQ